MYEVTKAEKKVLRIAIDIGLQKDYVAALMAMDALIARWKEKKTDNRDTYLALYKTIHKHDKLIGNRYNGLTGSRYLMLVCVLYAEGTISDADLVGLREETIQLIRRFKEF